MDFADVSPEALALAKRNAKRNGVDGAFFESDLFDRVPGAYDLIACNPPYLTGAELAGGLVLQRREAQHRPREAE